MGGGGRSFAPHAGEGGLDLLLEAGDQFAVGGDQRLLSFDLGDDGFAGWRGRIAETSRWNEFRDRDAFLSGFQIGISFTDYFFSQLHDVFV